MSPTNKSDWKFLFLGSWLLCGVFMDGWAHNNVAETIESFFTPWHAILYSGFLAVAAYHFGVLVRSHHKGKAWKASMPDGYELSLAGVLIFGASGACDMIWHLIFGIETSVSAGFSPPHLGIMMGTGLIVSGPFRAAWKRPGDAPAHWLDWLPALLSLNMTLSLMAFVTQYAHPLVVLQATTEPTKYNDQALGAVSIMLQAAILMGWILISVRRWKLPFGSLAIVLTLNAVAMSFMRSHFILIPAACLAGIGADLLLRNLKPTPSRPAQFRLFAFAVPVLYFLLYFATLLLTGGVTWPIPLCSGTVVMAGIIAVLLSFLIVPPPVREFRRS